MSKKFKRFFAGLLAFVLVFAMTAVAAPVKEVKADAEEYLMFLGIGAGSTADGWDLGYANDPANDNAEVVATTAMVSEGETVTIGLAMPSEVAKTWWLAPTLVASGIEKLDFTVDSILIDGEEVLENVDLNARADGPWWYEGTGVYTAEETIRLAGGYNEWGDKFMAESPIGWTEISYTITINDISTEAEETAGEVTVVELPEEIEIFLGTGGGSTADGWDLGYANDPANDNAEIVATKEMISVGETVTIGLTMPLPVQKTWWMAPTMVVSGVGSMDVTVDSIKFDGKEYIQEADFSLNPDRGMWWYEGTGTYTAEETIRLAGGYNEWADKYIAAMPTGWTTVEFTITLNSIAPVAPTVSNEIIYDGEFEAFLASDADIAELYDWGYMWSNSSTDKGGVTGTVVTAKAGDTVTVGLTYENPVFHTDWIAPVILLPEAEAGLDKYKVDYTLDKVLLDGVDITEKVDLAAGDASWYEGTGDYPVTRTIRLAGGYNEFADVQYLAGDVLAGFKTIEYTITINKIYGEVVTEVEEGPKVDKNGTYNVYFGIQSQNWSFRNAWDDATYGLNSADYPEAFGQMGLVDSTEGYIKKAGTFKDAVITGNGTYSVELNDIAWDDGSTALNLLFLSTDIPNSGEITFSNIKVDFDGKNVMDFAESFIDPDSKEWLKILFINIWNKDLTNSYPMADTIANNSIKITFDVSGFDYDNTVAEPEVTPEPTPEATVAPTEAPEPTEAPTKAPEPTAAPTKAPAVDADADAKGGVSPVLIVVIVAVVAAAGAGFVVMKKKK